MTSRAASSGMVLTNGTLFSRLVYAPDDYDFADWREITEAEYEEVTRDLYAEEQ